MNFMRRKLLAMAGVAGLSALAASFGATQAEAATRPGWMAEGRFHSIALGEERLGSYGHQQRRT